MPQETLARFVLLPEVELLRIKQLNRHAALYECQKNSPMEVCPRCATPSVSGYDRRRVWVKDSPIRGHGVRLKISKRRFWCKPCGKPFTEPVAGIKKGKRHTERYAASVQWACENFSDLKRVRRAFHCSSSFLYKIFYERLERVRLEKINYPWPKIVGIDEHAFGRNKLTGRTQFATMVVDYVNGRVRELVQGKTTDELRAQLDPIANPQNVQYAVTDLCDPFKNFVKQHLPNAQLVADKFHVLRLLTPSLLRKRREIVGTRADLRAKRLLLMSSHKLTYSSRFVIQSFLEKFPELAEIYRWKERMHGFYRIRGFERAQKALTQMTDEMASSQIKEIQTLRRTLKKWRAEILNYFATGLTNARTEGFNNRAKVVKRMAYGYRSFRNYRLRVLSACA